jgi:hypothetical protein
VSSSAATKWRSMASSAATLASICGDFGVIVVGPIFGSWALSANWLASKHTNLWASLP